MNNKTHIGTCSINFEKTGFFAYFSQKEEIFDEKECLAHSESPRHCSVTKVAVFFKRQNR